MGKSPRATKTVKKPATGAGDKKDEPEGAAGRPSLFSKTTLIVTAAAVGVLVLLLLLVHWLAAISVASGLWVFADATLMRLTRLRPSRKGFRLATMAWGVIGFVPLVGIAVYVYLRGALARASPGDVADASMSDEKMEKAGKLRAQRVSVPGAAVVAVLAAGLALAGRYWTDEMTLEFGTSYTKGLRIIGTSPSGRYNAGTILVKLSSPEPVGGYENLDWELYLRGKESAPVSRSTVRGHRSPDKTIWLWKIRARTPGKYRLDVLRDDGTLVKRGYFTIRPKY